MKWSQRFAYLACSLSIGVFSSFNNFTLSLWLSTFTTSYFLISLMGNTRSFEGALISPATGAWSDRTWLGWLGRRRPFILVGGLSSALLLAATPHIARLPLPVDLAEVGWLPADVGTLAPAILAIFLFTMAFNVMDDIHSALMVDLTPPGAERNWLSSLKVVTNMAGQAGILILGAFLWHDGVPDSAFLVTGGIMAAGVLSTVLGVREPAPGAAVSDASVRSESGQDSGERATLGTFWTHYRGAMVFCLVWFAYWFGVNAVLPLVSLYTRDILGASVGEAQLLPAVLLLSTTLFAAPMAMLGTRYGKRRVFSAGLAVMGVAALTGLVITTKEMGAVVFLLAGVGNAASMVLHLPLMADLVPRRHMGAAAGILAASASIAAPLASAMAGGLSDTFGPRVIFAMMAVFTGLALVLMLGVRRQAEPAGERLAMATPQAQPV